VIRSGDLAAERPQSDPSDVGSHSAFQAPIYQPVGLPRVAKTSTKGQSGSPSGKARLADWCVAAALCVFGILPSVVFISWRREPFDTLDYSEFLLLLQHSRGFWDQWSTLTTYYAGQGRVAEVIYGVIAAVYHSFGLDPLGWQIVRSIPMLFLPTVVFFVLRQFGAKRLSSLIGASLYAVGAVPAAACMRLTAEPVGTLFFLGSTSIAHGWFERQNGVARTSALALCLSGMVFSKETLIACLPFLCAVGMCWSAENDLKSPRLNRETAKFLGICSAVCLLLGAALLWAATSKSVDAYATLYGTSVMSSRAVITRVLQVFLPVFYYVDVWELLIFPPNLVFVACIVIGLVGLMRLSEQRRTATFRLLLAALLPAGGVLVYLPWPRFELFYWLPFLFGVALGIAILIESGVYGRRARLVVVICWGFVLTGSALHAFSFAQMTRAQRRLNYEVAQSIAALGPADTVFIASANLTSQSWQNPAATLSRYVRAVGLTPVPPVVLDVECTRGLIHKPYQRARHLQIVYEATCGDVRVPSREIEGRFWYFDWSTLTFQRSVQQVAVVDPSP
jgi:hypothetical protein